MSLERAMDDQRLMDQDEPHRGLRLQAFAKPLKPKNLIS
jgi:hypothetical protein